MPTYTAYFRNDTGQHAEHDIDAATPEEALKMARELWQHDPYALEFEENTRPMQLDEIEICGEYDAMALWQSNVLRLRLAAQDLLTVLEAIIDREDAESLFATPVLRQARAAIAKARPADETG